MLPDGLHYVDSWIVDDGALDRCFQLMETDDPTPVHGVARELARPRRLRGAPRHQVGRRRTAGRRDMDRRDAERQSPRVGRRGHRRRRFENRRRRWIVVRRSSSVRSWWSPASVATVGRGRRRVRRDRGRGVVVTAGGITGVGGGCGFGIGRPVSNAATTSAMNAARARVAARLMCTASTYDAESLAAAVFAHSATTHSRWPLHHCRSAPEYEPWRAYWSLPARACVVRNTTGRPPARRRASAQLFCQRDFSYRPESFVPNATTTTSPRAAASAHDFSNVSPDGAHVSLPGMRASYSISGRRPSRSTRHCQPYASDRPPSPSTAAAQPTRESALTRQRLGAGHQRVADHGDLTAIRAAGTDGGVADDCGGGGRFGEPPARHRVSRACRGDADHGLEVLHRGAWFRRR